MKYGLKCTFVLISVCVLFSIRSIIKCTWRFERYTNHVVKLSVENRLIICRCVLLSLWCKDGKNIFNTVKEIWFDNMQYVANLKLISVKCLTHVFNPSTYVLVFVAKIQDASFPPTHVSTQGYNITNSMYPIMLYIKYSYRKVGSTQISQALGKTHSVKISEHHLYQFWQYLSYSIQKCLR